MKNQQKKANVKLTEQELKRLISALIDAQYEEESYLKVLEPTNDLKIKEAIKTTKERIENIEALKDKLFNVLAETF